MRKYLCVITTTFNDSLQYIKSLMFKFLSFTIIMFVLVCLWQFIYSDGNGVIKGYTLQQMVWYIILGELITFGSGSKVARDEVQNDIRSGNIAYQVTKPYNYPLYIICKYYADTIISFLMYIIIGLIVGLLFMGPIPNLNFITIIKVIPVFLLAVLETGLIRILISLTSFWVEDSKPFQNVWNKVVLMFGILFPIEVFPSIIGNIIRYIPVYSISYGPAKLVINFNDTLYTNVLLSQFISIIIILIIINLLYRKGVRNLNVNGG